MQKIVIGMILLIFIGVSCSKKQVKLIFKKGYCNGVVKCLDCMQGYIQKDYFSGVSYSNERLEWIEQTCYFETIGEI